MFQIQALQADLARFSLDCSDALAKRLWDFCELVIDGNTRINLTAITEPEEMRVKHILDSLLLQHGAMLPQNAKLMDVGSGAGFPAIPIALARPDLRVTMLDATRKRVDFLNGCIDALHLRANAIHARAEEAARKKDLREQFDVVTARAVAALPILAELCLPFVKVGGVFAAMKGSNIDEELEKALPSLEKLGGRLVGTTRYALTEDGENARHIICIEKVSPTPPAYPRAYAKIAAQYSK